MKAKHVIIYITLLFAILTVAEVKGQVVTTTEQRGENALSYFIDAHKAIFEGKKREGEQLLDKSLSLNPENDAAWFLKSQLAKSNRNPKEALEFSEKAYNLDEKNSDYIMAYASNLLEMNRISAAREVLEKGAEIHPKSDEIVSLLSQVYTATGDFEKAKALVYSYKEKAGETHISYYMLYNLYNAEQNSEEALKVLLEADEKIPNTAWKELIAEEYLKNAKDSLAMVYYNKILEENPSSPSAMFGKMEIERTNGNIAEYFFNLDSYLERKDIPNDKKINYLREVLKTPYFFENYTDEFAESLNTFYNKFSKDTLVGYLAAQFNMVAKKENQAEYILRCLLHYYPNDIGVNYNFISFLYTAQAWGELKTFTGQHLEAKDLEEMRHTLIQTKATAEYFLADYEGAFQTNKLLEEYAKKQKDNKLLLDAYASLGDLAHTLGKNNECYKYYKKALSIDPEFCPVLNNYAWYLATDPKKQDLNKAQQMSKITIQKEAGNSTYLDTYAYILYKRGEIEEEKKYYQQAIAFGTDLTAVIYHHYAQCLYALGEYDLARTQYLNALNAAVNQNDTEELIKIEKEIEERNAVLKIYPQSTQ